MCEKTLLTRKIMACELGVQDARLFLDTHPKCKDALSYYNAAVEARNRLVKEYESRYGVITYYSTSENGYSRLNTPWPWQE